MKKLLLLLALLSGFSFFSSSTHIVGGDVSVTQTGPNTFVVTTRWFRYCVGSPATAPTTISTRFFDNVTNAVVQTVTMQKDSVVNIQFGDDCYTPPGLCVESHYYSATVTLANNPNGYYTSYGTCCRNGNIVNVNTNSNVWTVQIPDPAIAGGNSSPVFVEYPRDGYFCVNENKLIDFSCTDADGDSLVYSLVNPFDNTGPGGGRPFTLLGWQPGFNLANILGPGSSTTINRATGFVTARPAQLGLFVLSVRCEEYRGGVKIGEVYRDIQLSALNCVTNTKPELVDFAAVNEFAFENEKCIDFLAVDENVLDTFFMTVSSNAFQFGAIASVPAPTDSGYSIYNWIDPVTGGNEFDSARYVTKLTSTEFRGIGGVGVRFCWNLDDCDLLTIDTFNIDVVAYSLGCDGSKDTVQRNVSIPVTKAEYDYQVPNVFSPNGDGINDEFFLKRDAYDRCYDALNVRVYNRWGQVVFESQDAKFTWDGNDENGNELAAGTYFVILQGYYGGEEVTQNFPVTLFR